MSAKSEEAALPVNAEKLYLFDPNTKVFTINIHERGVVAFALFGFAAFLLVGILGYPSDPNGVYVFFHPAWALFLWFCAAILIVQLSIFRSKEATRWKIQSVAVTLVSMAIVAYAVTKPEILRQFVSAVIDQLNALGIYLNRGRVLWNLANFCPIALYTVERAIIWVRGHRARYTTIMEQIDIFGTDQTEHSGSFPSVWEYISQDLFAGAALCLVQAAIFQQSFFNFLARQINGTDVNKCDISWVTGYCGEGASSHPPTLSRVDLTLFFYALAASVLILAAVIISKVTFRQPSEVSPEIARNVWKTVSAAYNPFDIVLRNLRSVLWPACILIGTIGAAASARSIRLYLHSLSDYRTCVTAKPCADLRELKLFLSNSQDTSYFHAHFVFLQLAFLSVAIAGIVGGAFFILVSARLLVSGGRITKDSVVKNWIRFVLSIAHLALLYFWIPSFGLSVFVLALRLSQVTSRAPFPQLGISTSISLAYFAVVFATSRLFHRKSK